MVVNAVLLASGASSRFQRDIGLPKQAVIIRGIPLICYPLTSLSLAGSREHVIVVNRYNKHIIKEAVGRCPYYSSLTIYVDNNELWRDNGYSALIGLENAMGMGNNIIVSMTDHIYPSFIPRAMMDSEHALVFGGDSTPAFADVSEATKIGYVGGHLVFSKFLSRFDFIDIGVHKLSRFPFYSRCHDSVLPFSRLLTCISRYSKAIVLDVKGAPWIDVDTYHDYLEIVGGKHKKVIEMVWRDWEARGIRR